VKSSHLAGYRGTCWALAALMASYVGLVVAYQGTIPLFEAPDEQSHIHYVAFVSRERRLPHYDAQPEVPGEGMQPPLFYVLAAPLFSLIDVGDPALLADLKQTSSWVYGPEDTPAVSERARLRPSLGSEPRRFEPEPSLDYLRRLRWGTLPFGLLTLAFTAAGAWRFSKTASFTLLCVSIVAFDPQFIFVSSYVSNDAAAAGVGASAFWLISGALEEERVGRRYYVALGLLIGLGALTKNATLPVLAVTAVTLGVLDSRSPGKVAFDAVLAAVMAGVLLVPLAAMNLERFHDPYGLDALWTSARGLPRPADFGGLGPYLSRMYFFATFRSYWGVFGWMDVAAPALVYLAFFVLSSAGVIGFALISCVPGASYDLRRVRFSRYVAAAAAVMLALHLWLNLRLIQPQGRHLFAASPHIAALLTLGIAHISDSGGRRIPWPLTAGIIACLVGLALYCLHGVIAPAYP